ncbi:PilZ domain-containing protein [Salinarimonas ramus]|uniref:Pilus assembly protein PilZ n=1 Tax=Salinarimonas ramus TaxID=690164 RepID=A0A917Q6W2_9HYPH|nr:PilZ domain-containing protein [Salinarimonas ramus]GGK31373.1 pilus assembly protein PilZ [Salinarimonas ramus]
MTGSPMMLQREAAQPLRRSDRRLHARVKVILLGRYMLQNRQEYPCQTVDFSPGGVALVAPVRGLIGERVVCYFEHIGRVEGVIARHTDKGFAISITATARKRDKLASQLTWLANRHELGLPEDRRHERITPTNKHVVLKLDEGIVLEASLIDVSISGAGIAMDKRPAIGAGLLVGSTPARVVRHFQNGIAVEFLLPISPDKFDENIIL